MAVMRSGTEGETEIVAVINIMYRTFKDKSDDMFPIVIKEISLILEEICQ